MDQPGSKVQWMRFSISESVEGPVGKCVAEREQVPRAKVSLALSRVPRRFSRPLRTRVLEAAPVTTISSLRSSVGREPCAPRSSSVAPAGRVEW